MPNGIDSAWPQGALPHPPGDFNITCATRANVGLEVDDYYAARVDNTLADGKESSIYGFIGNVDPATFARFTIANTHRFDGGRMVSALDNEDW